MTTLTRRQQETFDHLVDIQSDRGELAPLTKPELVTAIARKMFLSSASIDRYLRVVKKAGLVDGDWLPIDQSPQPSPRQLEILGTLNRLQGSDPYDTRRGVATPLSQAVGIKLGTAETYLCVFKRNGWLNDDLTVVPKYLPKPTVGVVKGTAPTVLGLDGSGAADKVGPYALATGESVSLRLSPESSAVSPTEAAVGFVVEDTQAILQRVIDELTKLLDFDSELVNPTICAANAWLDRTKADLDVQASRHKALT